MMKTIKIDIGMLIEDIKALPRMHPAHKDRIIRKISFILEEISVYYDSYEDVISTIIVIKKREKKDE